MHNYLLFLFSFSLVGENNSKKISPNNKNKFQQQQRGPLGPMTPYNKYKGPVKAPYNRDRVPTYRRSHSFSSDSSYSSSRSRSRSRSPVRRRRRSSKSPKKRHYSRFVLILFMFYHIG